MNKYSKILPIVVGIVLTSLTVVAVKEGLEVRKEADRAQKQSLQHLAAMKDTVAQLEENHLSVPVNLTIGNMDIQCLKSNAEGFHSCVEGHNVYQCERTEAGSICARPNTSRSVMVRQ